MAVTKTKFINYVRCPRYVALDDIKKESNEKTYLLVAHNGISRIIESYFRNMTNEEFASFGIKNCEVKKYEFKDNY